MWKSTTFLTGAIFGAGAMYFFDPRMGNRRRALFQDQMRRLSRQMACGMDTGLRDLSNRTQGSLHDLGAFVSHGGNMSKTSEQRGRSGQGQGAGGWPPAARLLGAAGGTALMANCAVCRTPASFLAGTLGFGIFAKSIDAGPGGIHVTKSMEINAPADKVFDFFSHPKNYLRISDVVTNVQLLGDNRFAKDIAIAGIPVHFEERFVCLEPNTCIETRSEPASAVQYTKQLRLEEIGEGRTRLHLHFNYHPPGGTIGNAIASAFGIDAKSLLTDLLMRAKFFLETGREPHDAVCHRRGRSHQHQQQSGNGRGQKNREFPSNSPQGPGAPASDIHRAGIRDFRGETPWPASTEVRPEPASLTGQFPRTIE